MTKWVKLRTGEGQHFDKAVGLHIRNEEKKPLPKNVPAGSLTAQRLDMGALIYCDPPDDAVEVIEVEEAVDGQAETPGEDRQDASATEDRQDAGATEEIEPNTEAEVAAGPAETPVPTEQEADPAPPPPTKKKSVKRKTKP